MSTLFHRNPRLTILVVSLIMVSGLSASQLLPRLEDPELTNRFATVTTRLAGATPQRVEALVTEPIEDVLDEIEEIKVVESTSSPEVSIIQIELRDDVYEVDVVWSRVRDKLADVRPELPREATDPEFEEQETRAYAMIVGLSWTMEEEPNWAILRRRAEEIEDLFRGIGGTEDVELYGVRDEEILVEIDPARLAALGVSAVDVSDLLARSDARVSTGQLRSEREDLLLEVGNEFDTLERIRRTPLRMGADSEFVRLDGVASVSKGAVDPPDESTFVDGRPGIAIAVYVLSNYRIDLWAEKAQVALDEYGESLPRGMAITTIFNQSGYTGERLFDLLENLLLGGLAVVSVVLLLMGWRSAVLVGLVALPLSSLMVLGGMQLLGIPIHQMSVTGLIISLGLLIDTAIVMVDEIGREMSGGRRADEAIRHATGKLAVPLLGSTLTTALAFAPIALMPGPAGEFVGTIAISVILALFGSLFLAVTIVPALSAGLLGTRSGSANSIWTRGFSNARLANRYGRLLQVVFRRPWLGVGIGLVLPILGFTAATTLQEQFFPPTDRDQFHVQFELPANASLERTRRRVDEVTSALREFDEVAQVHWFLGRSVPSFYYNLTEDREYASNYAQAIVQLHSPEGVRDVIRRSQTVLGERFPEARLLARQLEQGPPFPAPVEFRVYGSDLDTLREIGIRAQRELAGVVHVVHTRSQLNEALPKLDLLLDEDELRLAGLDNADVARQLNGTLEGSLGGLVLEEVEEIPVRVRVANDGRDRLDRILGVELVSTAIANGAGDRHLPLAAVAEIEVVPENSAIPRRKGQRVNTIQGYITAGVLPADVLQEFEARLESRIYPTLPPGYTFDFGGEASKRDDAVGNLMGSVGVLGVLMVATLVLSFSSFRLAGIIGFVGFLSGGLGLGALYLFGYPFGFMAIVGTMGLIGVAINDAIVVLAALRGNEAAKAGNPDAIAEVVAEETRHVLATTLTTIAGFLPLVLAGGGFWPPLAVTIAGGVGGATILALSFVPATYRLLVSPARTSASETVPANTPEVVVPERRIPHAAAITAGG